MFRSELLTFGFFYDEDLAMSEDLDLWLRIMNYGYNLENLDQILLHYRIKQGFIDKRTSKIQRNYMAFVRKKNFTSRRFLFSMMSLMAGCFFKLIPDKAMKNFYSSENTKIEVQR